MGQLDKFKQLVDGMHKLMSDLVDAVPKDEFTTLTNDLASLKSTIAEIQVVKECSFIEEEAQNITGTAKHRKMEYKNTFRTTLWSIHCWLVGRLSQFAPYLNSYRSASILRSMRMALVRRNGGHHVSYPVSIRGFNCDLGIATMKVNRLYEASPLPGHTIHRRALSTFLEAKNVCLKEHLYRLFRIFVQCSKSDNR